MSRLGNPLENIPLDTGCRLHPKCLSCPRPTCVFDQDHRAGIVEAAAELRERAAHLLAIGIPRHQVGPAMGLSERSGYRLTKGTS